MRSRPFASRCRCRADDAQPWNSGENRRTGLRVIDGATLEVAAIGDAHDDRRTVGIVRPPPHQRELIAQLHVRRPDVVEELDFHDRLHPARRESDRTPDDVGLGERRVVDPRAAELLLQSPGDLEDAALPLHLADVPFARDVGDVFAEDENAWIAHHLVAQAAVDQVDHRGRLARELRVVFGVELFGRRIDVGRIDVLIDRVGARLRRCERDAGGDFDLLVHLRRDQLELRLGGDPLLEQVRRKAVDRVARRVGITLRRRAVVHLVIRERMRVRPDHLRVHERRTLALPGIVVRLEHHVVGRERIATVDLLHEQVRKRAHQLGNRAAGSIDLDRHRDRVAIVLDEEDNRQLEIARRVQCFPEFPFTRRPVACGAKHHFVARLEIAGA